MLKGTRVGVMSLLLAIGCAVLAPTRLAGQPQHQPSLQLHRCHYRVDENGQTWLWVSLANSGSKPVTIAGISPAQNGPWTLVKRKVDSGGIFRGALKIPAGQPPAALWVDSTEGLEKFDLPAH